MEKKERWIKPRHRVVRNLLFPFIGLYTRLSYGDRVTVDEEHDLLLATMAPVRPVLTLILLALFFVVMNVILFRSLLFRKKK